MFDFAKIESLDYSKGILAKPKKEVGRLIGLFPSLKRLYFTSGFAEALKTDFPLLDELHLVGLGCFIWSYLEKDYTKIARLVSIEHPDT